MTSPTAEYEAVVVDLTIESVLVWVAVTVTWLEGPVTGVEPGPVPLAVEVSLIEPLSMSAWVTL